MTRSKQHLLSYFEIYAAMPNKPGKLTAASRYGSVAVPCGAGAPPAAPYRQR